MSNLLKENRYLIFSITFVAVFSLLPLIYSIYLAGPDWQGILPEYTNDGLYYYARMSDVSKGDFFLGSPYFLEHTKEYAPAFFVADWLASWPLLLGLDLTQTVFINYLLWSLFSFFVLILLFREIGLSRLAAILGSLIGYLSVHELMSRPVIMQVVFPFYILFLVALIHYIQNPQGRKAIISLIFIYAFSFYLYSYLWQISLLSIFLLGAWLVFKKKWLDIKSLLLINLATFLLALPVIFYTYWQINSPYFLETITRLGLVKTHLPTYLAVFDCLIIFVSWLLLLLVFRWVQFKDDNIIKFFTISGLTLIMADLSNMITGQEIEISNHIGRFITLWLVIVLVFLIFWLKKNYSDFLRLSKNKKAILLSLSGVIIFMLILPVKFFLPSLISRVTNLEKIKIKEIQTITQPLSWLEKNAKSNSVIWASNRVSYYIPIYTHHYVLFSPLGGLHLMPSAELEERYLVASYFRDLTLIDIKNDFRSYAGVGNAIHQYRSHNRQVKLCHFLMFEKIGYSCGKIEDNLSWRGEKYFFDLYQKYLIEIKPNINRELTKYGVSYILIDRKEDQIKLSLDKLSNIKSVYDDNRFEIYKINRSL